MSKGLFPLFLKVSLQSSWIFFTNLLIPTLIKLFYEVTFKIKFLLFVVFSMFQVAQWWGNNIFLLLKVHMNLDFSKLWSTTTKYVYGFLNVDASKIGMLQVATLWSFEVQYNITLIVQFFTNLHAYYFCLFTYPSFLFIFDPTCLQILSVVSILCILQNLNLLKVLWVLCET